MILAPVIIAVIIVIAGFWYWSKRKTREPVTPGVSNVNVIKTKDGLGAEAFNKSNNPLSNKLPETNPFNVETNSFK